MSKVRHIPAYLKAKLENFNYRKHYEAELVLSRFSSMIEKVIDSRKLTKKSIADRLGVSPQSVSRALRAEQNLTVTKMVELALAVDCQLHLDVVPCDEIVYFGEYSTNNEGLISDQNKFYKYLSDIESNTPIFYHVDQLKTA